MDYFANIGISALLLFYLSNFVISYNLDVRIPIVKHGTSNSFFGFSIAQHQIGRKSSVKNVFLVGAPKDNITGPNVKPEVLQLRSPGVVYSCPLTSELRDCVSVKLDQAKPYANEDKNGQWMGVSVTSSGSPTGKAMACAHRYVLKKSESAYWGLGICVGLSNDLDEDSFQEPCQGKNIVEGHGDYGFCQAGTSGAVAQDGEILLGAPGLFNWRGGVFKNRIADSLTDSATWWHSRFKDVKEKDNKPIKDPPPTTRYYTYLGMSTEIGNVLQGKRTYIAGAPRSKDSGEVLLFLKGAEPFLEANVYLTGDLFGSGFGTAVAVVDLNSDGHQDLVVGAPFFHSPERDAGGAIYVYMNGKMGITQHTKPLRILSRKMPLSDCRSLNCQDARFGFSIANVGDLDRDGFQDIAVGAPFEGRGCIYIFRGGKNGLNAVYSQRISAEELVTAGSKLNAFGYSISGGIDMDDNGYPDVAIGAYHGDMALVLRARPIVNISASIQPQVRGGEVDPKETRCHIDGRRLNCFAIRLCFSFTSEPQESFRGPLSIEYTVEAEKFAGKAVSRVIIQGSPRDSTHKLTRPLELKAQGKRECERHTVHITRSNRDFLNPIEFLLTYKLYKPFVPTMAVGDPLPDINKYPVLNRFVPKVQAKVHFKKNCGADQVCNSDVTVKGRLQLEQDHAREDMLRQGQDKKVRLAIDVDNLGEDAHEATLEVLLPEGLTYVGIDSNRQRKTKKRQVTCIPKDKSITCRVGNPLRPKNRKHFTIRLDSSNLRAGNKRLNISLRINTSSEPTSVFYGGLERGESAMQYEEQIGPLVVHTYLLRNLEYGAVANCSVTIRWPYEVESRYPRGKHLLYLLEQPQVESLIPASCDVPRRIVNPINLGKRPRHVGNFSAETSASRRRVRRQIASEKYYDRELDRTLQIVVMDCERGTAKCADIKCDIGTMEHGDSVVIKLRSRLWNNTFMEDYRSVDQVHVYSTGQLYIPPVLGVRQPDVSNDYSRTRTVAAPDIDVQRPREVQLWVIIVSAIGGVLVLIVIVLILWKCGFFKRRKPEDRLKNGDTSTAGLYATSPAKRPVSYKKGKQKPDAQKRSPTKMYYYDENY